MDAEERWCGILKSILAKRVAGVPKMLKIELMCILEKLDSVHPIIADVFVEAVIQSFEEMVISKL